MNIENFVQPEGVDDETFRRAWDSLSEADRHVLLVTAKNGYKPKVDRPVRTREKTVKRN